MVRVAVVGAGPAGLYAAAALRRDDAAEVDVFDRLPCPFGLVRYGVAPDHPKIRSIASTLRVVLEDPAVRFLGNVDVGRDVSVAELHQHYDAIVFAHGAAIDRRLGVPGEDLSGSVSATDFVAWYNGHPDLPLDRYTLDAESVAVVGAGNVALDVARVLVRDVDELRRTDMPDHVLDVLAASKVRDVHLVARRGPAQAKFTTHELRELGDLSGVDIVVDPAELELDAESAEWIASHPPARRNVDVLREWAARDPAGHRRRVHLHFWQRPVAVLGDTRVEGLSVERTTPVGGGRVVGTGALSSYDVELVVRSVGYRGLALAGLPFDEDSGTVPHLQGRVVRDGAVAPGEYVAGWIKRGPTGVVGTNKHDANETVQALLADLDTLPRAPERDPAVLPALLEGRGVVVVTWQGWCSIEAAEAELGRVAGRERSKITQRAELLAAAATRAKSRNPDG